MGPQKKMMEMTARGYDEGVAEVKQLRLAEIETREVVRAEEARDGELRFSAARDPYK